MVLIRGKLLIYQQQSIVELRLLAICEHGGIWYLYGLTGGRSVSQGTRRGIHLNSQLGDLISILITLLDGIPGFFLIGFGSQLLSADSTV